MSAPLDTVRILDLTRVLAGPWSGQLLGDYGADVVKIERPVHGDDTRHWGPPWLADKEKQSAYFLAANRNKRSLTVDFSESAGQQIIRDLVTQADVLIENYKVGTMARYGLGPADLLSLNSRLIYCSISAFGQTGSRAPEPGYDAVIQASAGLMSVTGPAETENGGPQKVGVAISDIMAGMYATTAILAALHARNGSGEGQHIDVPLYDSQVAWLANQNMNYLVGGEIPTRLGTAHPNLVPYQVFRTGDGDLMLAVGNDAQFRKCCMALELAELIDDQRFATMSVRVGNREELIPMLQSAFLQRGRDDWLEILRSQGIPAGPVNTIDTVLTDQHAVERELVRHIDNADGIPVPTVSNPVAFQETPVEYRFAPPNLGEHSDEVLREWLGYSDAKIHKLRQDEVI